MNPAPPIFAAPDDKRALAAIDLGAESCRISLLRWMDGDAQIETVCRFANRAVELNASMHWDLQAICKGIDRGLRQCAEIAGEGISSIGVDGWAVDYVRLGAQGSPLSDPYCYRDRRTARAFQEVHRHIGVERLYELTGIQPLTINTLYQLYADSVQGIPAHIPWINLPEYVLHWLGGERVAEYTMATHSGMVDLATKNWSREVFDAANLDINAAPSIVRPGTEVGKVRGMLRELPAFADTRLIAPACHDTASAVAGITAVERDWAYISSGTWSLVGALIDTPCNTEEARQKGFTNLGSAGNRICFHKNVNGMWIMRQCVEHWAHQDRAWTIPELIEQARLIAAPDGMLDLEDGDLLLAGNMPARINAQRQRLGFKPIAEPPDSAPQFASLIFHSLAHKYAQVLKDMRKISGKNPQCIYVVGGGSRNDFLNGLTEQATGIKVRCGDVESSTIGNLKVQLALSNRN